MDLTIFAVLECVKEMQFWSDQFMQALDFELEKTLKAIINKMRSKMYVYLHVNDNNVDEENQKLVFDNGSSSSNISATFSVHQPPQKRRKLEEETEVQYFQKQQQQMKHQQTYKQKY